jgi:hypothetical protein
VGGGELMGDLLLCGICIMIRSTKVLCISVSVVHL